eukprot:17123_6
MTMTTLPVNPYSRKSRHIPRLLSYSFCWSSHGARTMPRFGFQRYKRRAPCVLSGGSTTSGWQRSRGTSLPTFARSFANSLCSVSLS